jgi:hypothetical protein
MGKRVIVVAGLLLAMLGVVPAAPAFADAAKECVTIPMVDPPYGTLASTCIAWDDNPAGPNWTLYQAKIWNPPGTGPSVLNAIVRYNNGNTDGQIHTIGDGGTLTLNIPKPYAVGPSTTLFVIWPQGQPNLGYCNYRTPHGGTSTVLCTIDAGQTTMMPTAR